MGNDLLCRVATTIAVVVITILIGRAAEKTTGKKPERVLNEEA
jgi:hypothetical protein